MTLFRSSLFLFIMLIIQSCSPALVATPTLEQPDPALPTSTLVQVSAVPSTPTTEVLDPTPMPVFEPPTGFKEYQDSIIGVSVFVPENWVVIEADPGRLAYLQSYPEYKYIGGEAFQPSDTKCDLNIRPPGSSIDELIQQWTSDSFTTIISNKETILYSGQPGIRIELDSRGRSISVLAEINERVVVLTCFGELAPFDQIASSLNAVSAPAADPTPTASSTSSCALRNDWYEYIVTTGDTLFNISQRAGSSVDEMVLANCLDDPSRISIGQKLYVPNPIPDA